MYFSLAPPKTGRKRPKLPWNSYSQNYASEEITLKNEVRPPSSYLYYRDVISY